MNVLVAVNEASDPLGLLGPPLAAAGLETTLWDAKKEPAPADVGKFAAVIALGGATNPDQDGVHPWLAAERALLRSAVARDIPVLGVCLGAQLLAQAFGGTAYRLAQPRSGWYGLEAHESSAADPLAPAWTELRHVLEWHAYGFTIPPGGVLLAGAPGAVQAFRLGRCAWGIQYHLEADLALASAWASAYPDDLRAARTDPAALSRQGERFRPGRRDPRLGGRTSIRSARRAHVTRSNASSSTSRQRPRRRRRSPAAA